jgi:GT2 family glycosyltransferase
MSGDARPPVDLSIIIVTYNGCEITLKTLDHYRRAVAGDTHHRYDFIVVDNASRDGVAEAVAARCPDVRLLRNAENIGFSAANNVGYRLSSGRYLLFSNPDIEVDDETLPTLIRLMDEDPQVGACTPFLRLVRTGEIDWGAHRGFPTPWAALTYFTKLDRLFKPSRGLSRIFGRYHLLDRDLSQPHPVDAIRGGFFFVRRQAFEKAGGWDEDYFMFGEDLDLCFQIKGLGYKVMFYPQAQALHYHGMTTGLKRHSQDLTEADAKARQRTYDAFYHAMKIFYDKNYKTRYGRGIRWLILAAIDLKKLMGARSKTV